MANTIQVRRGANASLPTLNAGEFGFSTDTYQTYIGDGAANHELGKVQTASIYLPAEASYLPATAPAELAEIAGSGVYGGYSILKFDDTTSEHCVFRVPVPDYDGGNIIVTAYGRPATTPGGAVTGILNILTIGLATSEAFNEAVVVDTDINITFNLNTTELLTDLCVASGTINPNNVAADDILVIEFSRDVSDTLTGDLNIFSFLLEYTRS